MIPVPKLDKQDFIFGRSDFLPKYHHVPDTFKTHKNPYTMFIIGWFTNGRTSEQMLQLKERKGVVRNDATQAIHVLLLSRNVKNDKYKIAGAAYLLSQWFTLEPNKQIIEKMVKDASLEIDKFLLNGGQ